LVCSLMCNVDTLVTSSVSRSVLIWSTSPHKKGLITSPVRKGGVVDFFERHPDRVLGMPVSGTGDENPHARTSLETLCLTSSALAHAARTTSTNLASSGSRPPRVNRRSAASKDRTSLGVTPSASQCDQN